MNYIPNTELVIVLDKNILVHQSNLILASKLELMQKDYELRIQVENPDMDPIEFNLVYNFAIPMVICSECINGEMWLPEEVVKLPEIETDKWFSIVRKINPHYFPGFRANGNLSEEDELKKKEL